MAAAASLIYPRYRNPITSFCEKMTGMLLRCLIFPLVSLSTFTSFIEAQTARELFGSREPITCSSTTEPKKGVMTAEIARRYVICRKEHKDDRNISLIDCRHECRQELRLNYYSASQGRVPPNHIRRLALRFRKSSRGLQSRKWR